jgi:hypothetical protein
MNALRRHAIRFAVSVVALIPAFLIAQQRDARVTPNASAPTAEISGVVVSAENSTQTLRRVVVTVTGGGLNPRSVLTDDGGRFVFDKLPAGSFSVTARKAAFIAAQYGARKPGRAGMPIVLGAGQKAAINISMFRGAAMTGVLRDASGEPVRGVAIRIIDARTLKMTTQDAAAGDLATTDDRGVFRLYGLLPGDYFVAALPVPNMPGVIVAPGTTSNDAALAALGAGRPGGAGSVAGASTPLATPTPPPIGFAPTFFPGTANPDAAVAVHLETGEEHAGVDFPVSLLPTAAIEGTVRGVPNVEVASVTLIPIGPRVLTTMTTNSLTGHGIDAQGRYKYGNLTPGRYRVIARGSPAVSVAAFNASPAAPGAVAGRGNGPAPSPDYYFGFADVQLDGRDLTNIDINLQPGGTITGRLVFVGADNVPRQVDVSKFNIGLALDGASGQVRSGGLTMGDALVTSSRVVNADGTFEIRAIGPGRFTLMAGSPVLPEGQVWKPRSAMAGDRDLLDDVLELGPGTDLRNVVVTFSDAPAEISGTLQGASGELVTDYYIVALPADRALWRPKSRRILYVRPGTDGRFVFSDPPSGEYVLAVVTDLDPIDLTSSSFLEPLAASGVKVTLREAEKKVQDMKIK